MIFDLRRFSRHGPRFGLDFAPAPRIPAVAAITRELDDTGRVITPLHD